MTTLITVHGTNAGDDSNIGEQWWQRESAFQRRLQELVAEPLEFIPFHWSGKNSERERREAGNQLRRKLQSADRENDTLAVIGHSHGGSVVNHALFATYAKGRKFQSLKAWITVGTPFIHLKRVGFFLNRFNILGQIAFLAIATFLIVALAGSQDFFFDTNTILKSFGLVGKDLSYKLDTGSWLDFEVATRNVLLNILIPVLIIFVLSRYTARARKRNSNKHTTGFWNQFSDSWVSLYHQSDEAISGLKSAKKVNAKIVPYSTVRSVFSSLLIVLFAVNLTYVTLLQSVPDHLLERFIPDRFHKVTATLTEPGDTLTAGFSADGSLIVTASQDLIARIWDAKTLKELRQLRGHKRKLVAASFSRDGRRVITRDQSRTIRIWDTVTGELLQTHKHENATVTNKVATLSPDGKKYIVNWAGDLIIHDASTGAELVGLWAMRDANNKYAETLKVAEFSPDGNVVATGSSKGGIGFWDASNGTFLHGRLHPIISAEHPESLKLKIDSLHFSSDGSKILTTDKFGQVVVWSIERTESGSVGNARLEFTVRMNADGERLIGASMDQAGEKILISTNKRTELWSVVEQRLLTRYADDLAKGEFSGYAQRILSPSGEKVLIATENFGETLIIEDEQGGYQLVDEKDIVGAVFMTSTVEQLGRLRSTGSGTLVEVEYIGKLESYADIASSKPEDSISYSDASGIWASYWGYYDIIEYKRLHFFEYPLLAAYWFWDSFHSLAGEDGLKLDEKYTSLSGDDYENDELDESWLSLSPLMQRLLWHGQATLFQLSNYIFYFIFAGAAWVIGWIVSFVVLKPAVWLLNRSLSGQIRNIAYGNDAYGEKLREVSEFAHLDDNNSSAAAWQPLPDELGNEIETYTQSFAMDTLNRVRKLLGVNAMSAELTLGDALSDQLSWKELIHTAYFDIDNFVKLMAVALINKGIVTPSESFFADPEYEKICAWFVSMKSG